MGSVILLSFSVVNNRVYIGENLQPFTPQNSDLSIMQDIAHNRAHHAFVSCKNEHMCKVSPVLPSIVFADCWFWL